MLNLDPAKLFVILLVAFVVLGPERLPKVARQLGGAWRELTRIRTEVTEEVRSAFPIDDLPHIPHIPNASSAVSSFVSSFTDPIRSTLGGALSASGGGPPASGAATSASDEVVSEIEGERATWSDEAWSDEVAIDSPAARPADEEARQWSERTSGVSDAVAFRANDDWSLFADDPSMN